VTLVFRRENGYGTIDANSEPFQVGGRLYETHVLMTKLGRGDKVPPEKTIELAGWYRELVTLLGELRADYSSLLEVINGRAEYEYDEDGLRYRVRRECLGRAPKKKEASDGV
jgi:hypothetical protein